MIEAQATANIRRDLEKLLIPWSGQWIGLRLIQPSQNFEKSFLYSFEIGKNKFFPYRAQRPHKCEAAAARRGDYLECSQVRGSGSAGACVGRDEEAAATQTEGAGRGRGGLELQLLMDITSSYGETSSQHGIFRCKPRE